MCYASPAHNRTCSMDVSIAAIIQTLVASLLSGAAVAWFAKGKTKAETSDIVTQAAERALKIMSTSYDKSLVDIETRMNTLERKLGRAMGRINCLMGGIDRLIEQITARQDTPVWKPDRWDIDDDE